MKKIIRKIRHELESADIQINGNRPWDIQVHDDRLFERVMRQGSLGLGEAYMDSWWETEALDQFFTRILQAKLEKKFVRNPVVLFELFKSILTNRQNKEKAYEIGKHHYDLENDLYRLVCSAPLPDGR